MPPEVASQPPEDAREGRYERGLSVLVKAVQDLAHQRIPGGSFAQAKTAPSFVPRNPYKGLRAFTAADRHDFFGRERLIGDLIDRLKAPRAPGITDEQQARLVAVVGPSGSGKSSVVLAGVLPRLQAGAVPGSEQWIYLEPMVPGNHPLERLALALAEKFPERSLKVLREDLEDDEARGLHLLAIALTRKRPEARVVLVIDQFEELFTQTTDEAERQRFIELLVTAVTEPRGPLYLLLTLRADFYDRPMQQPTLGRLIETHHRSVLPMDLEDLRAVIEQPAALPDVQLTFEGTLVGDLLFEVQGQAGALPLLQFTLDQLFEHRDGHRLTLAAYRELGGVKGALAKHAEATYAALPSDEYRALARALFLRLIDPGANEQETTRRRAAVAELNLADPQQAQRMQEVADAFVTARLLITNELAGTATIEVSHEALIREWGRLGTWLREAREDIPLQQRLSTDSIEWARRGRPKDRLYRGSQLNEAHAWAKRYLPSGQEAAFLSASSRLRRRSQISVVSLVLVFVLLTGVAVQLFLRQNPTAPNLTTVTTLLDSGQGSLRADVASARPGSTITFAANLKGIIKLSRELDISKNLVIRGPGSGRLKISGNPLVIGGGAIVTISDLTFDGSSILITTNNFLTLNGVSVLNNTGSGITSTRSRVTIINSTISGNKSDKNGGGILNIDGLATVVNSTIVGNSTAGSGGGILNQLQGKVVLTFSTVYNNTAAQGGGVANDVTVSDAVGRVELSNSIIAGNHAATSPDLSGPMVTTGYNLLQDTTGASFVDSPSGHPADKSITTASDLLMDTALGDHDGPTQTLALLSGSPAIDAVPLDACHVIDPTTSQPLITDQRGKSRPDDHENTCDIGAYESSG